MIERCPSCGSPVPEQDRICPSCGWDFVTHKRVAKPVAGAPSPAPPATPEPPKPELPKPEPPKISPLKPIGPAPSAPSPSFGGFALPPARNLNEGPSPVHGLKPLPKLEPREIDAPGEDENPFTLPSSGTKTPPAPEKKPDVPPKKDPAPPEPVKEMPVEKEGFGSRFIRSLRRDAAAPDAPEKKEPPSPAPVIPPEPVDEPPPRARTPEAPVRRVPPPPPPEEPGLDLDLDLDGEPAPVTQKAPPPSAPARPPMPAEEPPAPVPDAAPRAAEPEAPAPAKARAPESAAPTATPAPQAARNSPVYIAAVAGAALGTVSVLAVYLLLRPDTTAGVRPPSGDSPFSRDRTTLSVPAPASPSAATPPASAPPAAPLPAQSPAPLIEAPASAPAKPLTAANAGGPIAPPPPPAAHVVKAPPAAPASAPEDEERPSASFATLPRVVVGGQLPPEKPKPKPAPRAASDEPAPRKARPAAEARPRKPKGPAWNFEGVVFDLLTARGVFAAKLAFLDADGNVAGETETGPGGRYKVALPPGDAKGYMLKISHSDYTDRYIDEGDATSSLREATPEERKILMQAAARNLPWVGNTGKSLHRDLALVPRTTDEP